VCCSHRKPTEHINNIIQIRSTKDGQQTTEDHTFFNRKVTEYEVVCHSCDCKATEGVTAALQSAVWWHCEVLTDSGQTVEDSSGHSDTEPTDGTLWGADRQRTECRRQHWTQRHRTNRRYIMRCWQTVKDSSGHSDTEPTDGTLWGNDRQWTDCRRQQWTQWQRTNRQYIVRYRQTVDIL
jgi:hypothetical protein